MFRLFVRENRIDRADLDAGAAASALFRVNIREIIRHRDRAVRTGLLAFPAGNAAGFADLFCHRALVVG